VGGISDSVLSDRLSELARAGLVHRTVDDGPPVAVSYQLTEAGESLTPVFQQLATWARDSLPPRECTGDC
jgi:DNA-binding HxlR family transcriptional regulator